jgi:hypothetical protein
MVGPAFTAGRSYEGFRRPDGMQQFLKSTGGAARTEVVSPEFLEQFFSVADYAESRA